MPVGVTVIIPVYQGVDFLEAAVRSALEQPEVEEVIISDDGSTDGTWEVARALEREHPAVTTVCGPDRQNQGVSVARNRGAQRASCPLIAFLDADDYYLPERFRNAVPLLTSEPTVAGVYEPVGTTFSDEAVESVWFNDLKRGAISWTGRAIPPEALFEHLCTGRHFHIAGVTLRKDAFFSVGGFNPELRISEDTELWLKLALSSRIVAGSERVVAMRRVHGNNTIIARRAEQPRHGERKWRQIARWAAERKLPPRLMDAVSRNLVWSIAHRHRAENGRRSNLLKDLAMAAYDVPRIALTSGYWSQVVSCLSYGRSR